MGPGNSHQPLEAGRDKQQVEHGAEAARRGPVEANGRRLHGSDRDHRGGQPVEKEGEAAGQAASWRGDSWHQPVGGNEDVGGKGEANNGGKDEEWIRDGEVGEPQSACATVDVKYEVQELQ